MNPVFEIRILGTTIPDTIVVSLVLTIVLVVGAWLSTRRLKTRGLGLWQAAIETYTGWIDDTVREVFGEDPAPYSPLIGTLILYIAVCNLISAVPYFRAPTADLSATTALAAVVMLAVPYYGIRRHGVLGYLRTYIRPHPILLPFNLAGEISRTLALAIRLFGNMMSGHMVGAVLILVAGALIPVAITMLGILTGLVQAYIFGILAAVFIAAAVQVQPPHVDGKKP